MLVTCEPWYKLRQRAQTDETNLEDPGNLFGIGAVHVCLCDRPHVEQFAVGTQTDEGTDPRPKQGNNHESKLLTHSMSSTIQGMDCSRSCSLL